MKTGDALNIIKPEAHTHEAVKSAWRALCKVYHPDLNPLGGELMKLINAAFDVLMERFNEWSIGDHDTTQPDILESIIKQWQTVKHCPGLVAEVCGVWLWVTGDTRTYKDQLKAAAFRWSNNKLAWYWHPGKYRRKGKRDYSLDEIRQRYGSNGMSTEPLEAVA